VPLAGGHGWDVHDRKLTVRWLDPAGRSRSPAWRSGRVDAVLRAVADRRRRRATAEQQDLTAGERVDFAIACAGHCAGQREVRAELDAGGSAFALTPQTAAGLIGLTVLLLIGFGLLLVRPRP